MTMVVRKGLASREAKPAAKADAAAAGVAAAGAPVTGSDPWFGTLHGLAEQGCKHCNPFVPHQGGPVHRQLAEEDAAAAAGAGGAQRKQPTDPILRH